MPLSTLPEWLSVFITQLLLLMHEDLLAQKFPQKENIYYLRQSKVFFRLFISCHQTKMIKKFLSFEPNPSLRYKKTFPFLPRLPNPIQALPDRKLIANIHLLIPPSWPSHPVIIYA